MGYIPETVVFIRRPTTIDRKVGTHHWKHNAKPEDDEIIPGCYETFIADATNKRTRESGVNWAKRDKRIYNEIKKQWEMVPEPDHIIEERPNIPFKRPRIIDLDIRGQGGRAYKVILPDKTVMDLRENELLDVIFNEGIEPGGYLNGKYVFACENEMKIVRVGSEKYNELLVETSRRNSKSISTKDLKVGYFYETPSGEKMVFGGFGKQYVKGLEFLKKPSKVQLWLQYNPKNYIPAKPEAHFSDWATKTVKSRKVVKESGKCDLEVDIEKLMLEAFEGKKPLEWMLERYDKALLQYNQNNRSVIYSFNRKPQAYLPQLFDSLFGVEYENGPKFDKKYVEKVLENWKIRQ